MSFGGGGTVKVEQGRVDDLQSIIGGSQYGADIARVFGTARVSCNLVWAAKPIEHKQTETTTSGGKGGGGGGVKTKTVTYSYTCSFAVMAGAGPVYGVSKIWAGGVLIYDLSESASTGSISASNKLLNSNLTIYTGTTTQGQDPTIVADKGAANTPAYRGRVLLVFRDFDLTPYDNRIPVFQAEVVEYGQLFGGNQITPLKRGAGHVLSTLCQEAGILPGQIDVSSLTDEMYGITLPHGTYRDAIQPVLDAFAIRAVLSGNKLKFRPANVSAVDMSVPESALGADQSGTLGTRIDVKRVRDYDLPRRVTVTYADIARQDEISSQTFRRMAPGGSRNDQTLDLPMLLDTPTAARIAETKCFRAWVERDSYALPLGPRYVQLDPGDIFTAVDGSITHQIRATKINYGYNGQVRIEGVAHNPAVSTSDSTGAPGTPGAPTIPDIGTTVAHMLDLPALRDDLADARIFFAATGASAGWKAATLYVSVDGGISFSPVTRLEQKSTVGTTVGALPDAGPLGATYWDDAATVDVDLVEGELESLSDTLTREGGNVALIGNEIIQYANATLLSPLRYRLSRLLRGRRGTEWAMTGHSAGERFVLLSTAGTATVSAAIRGAVRYYKIVPDGLTLADVAAIAFTWDAEVLRPFSGVQASASRDGPGNITLTWIRRSRLGQEMPDGSDIPLGEAVESYSIDVLDGIGNTVRTIAASTSSVIYSAADQITDFGGVQSSVRFKIYQLSQIVGRGRVLDVTL